MNTSQTIRNLLVGLVLATFIAGSGCAGNQKQESTGEYVDDTVLTTKVKGEIFNDPALKLLQINVESYKGVVQLSGFVDSANAATKAVEVANSVKGVKAVKNSLIVR